MFDSSYEFNKISNWKYVWYETDSDDANILTISENESGEWGAFWKTYEKSGSNWSKNSRSILNNSKFFGTMLKCVEEFTINNSEYTRIEIGPTSDTSLFNINVTLIKKLVSANPDLSYTVDSDNLTAFIVK
jgi:hypothetical protein